MKLTGWILPDGSFEPLDNGYHEDFLARNAAELKHWAKFKKHADPLERLKALNAGFTRIRYTGDDGVYRVESSARKFTDRRKFLIREIENHADFIDTLHITLLSPKGEPVDSSFTRAFQYEDGAKISVLVDGVKILRGRQ